MLVVHPETIGFYERFARGERILWLAPMQLLFCYSARYMGDPDQMVWGWCPWGIEAAYPFDERGHWSKDRVVAVQFNSFAGQLREGGVLDKRDASGNIPALAVFDDIVAYCARRSIAVSERHTALIRRIQTFLEAEVFLIPQSVWTQALPRERQ